MNSNPTLESSPTDPNGSEQPPITDESLLEMIQTRRGEGLRCLHDRRAPLLKQISRDILHNEGEVEDVLQEVFVQIWNQATSYDRAKGPAIAWIVTMTRRRSIDRLRRREARGRAAERFAEEINGQSDHWTHVHEDLAQGERKRYLGRALAVLPGPQRDALRLAYYAQMSQREIAAHTGLPLGTIKTRLELGLKKLAVLLAGFRDLLEDEAGAPAR
jgi:RNA polymerase sigma-70 factor (ECF subfamily)